MRSIAWIAVLSLVVMSQVAEAGRRGGRGGKGSDGSAGGAGSAGGSGGSMGSSGGFGSSGGAVYGSSGGSSGGVVVPVTSVAPDRAALVLHVPAEATVYMYDQKMTMDGSIRNFVTPKLKEEKVYSVPVRVEWLKEGKKYTARGTQKLRTGDRVEVEARLSEDGSSLLMAQKEGQKGILEFTPDQDTPSGIANNTR